jgi:hypothetical protein
MEILIGIFVFALLVACGLLGFVIYGIKDHGKH